MRRKCVQVGGPRPEVRAKNHLPPFFSHRILVTSFFKLTKKIKKKKVPVSCSSWRVSWCPYLINLFKFIWPWTNLSSKDTLPSNPLGSCILVLGKLWHYVSDPSTDAHAIFSGFEMLMQYCEIWCEISNLTLFVEGCWCSTCQEGFQRCQRNNVTWFAAPWFVRCDWGFTYPMGHPFCNFGEYFL